jgi:hypothetical protein
MSFLFWKKETELALAEVLENGREKANKIMNAGRNKNYRGPDIPMKISVRVEPPNDYPFETQMKTSVAYGVLLLPGVRVQVKYPPGKQGEVTFADNEQEILKRNPQLIKKA